MSGEIKIQGAGLAIRKLREQAGVSLGQLAKELGWDKGRLSRYENNELGLSLSVIHDIAKKLNHRPEFVVLSCLQECYPSLRTSEVGQLVRNVLKRLSQE